MRGLSPGYTPTKKQRLCRVYNFLIYRLRGQEYNFFMRGYSIPVKLDRAIVAHAKARDRLLKVLKEDSIREGFYHLNKAKRTFYY